MKPSDSIDGYERLKINIHLSGSAGLGLVDMNKRYSLAKGTQVREEDFGLLFYQMNGPRLHFMASGSFLSEDFFQGEMTLKEWMGMPEKMLQNRVQEVEALGRALKRLSHKGVIVEC